MSGQLDPNHLWTEAETRAFRQKRRARNIALLVVLGGMVVLFYAISMAKMVVK